MPILDTVDGEIRRLERLVSDFLAFARPHPLQLESVLVSQLFENVEEQLAPHLEKAGVSLHIEKGSPEAPVEADRERLRQALCNLARNALDAMPDGGRLTLRVCAADDDGFVAVDILAAHPEVDVERLGAVGHSLGAKEVLYQAAFDERIKVAVRVCFI